MSNNRVSPNRRGAGRRRGTVLVLVMALLGILFVMGVTFIATMNSASESSALELVRKNQSVGGDGFLDDAYVAVKSAMTAVDSGIPLGAEPLGQSGSAYVELPDVHNTFSPLEPVWFPYEGAPGAQLVFRSWTDISSMVNGPYDGSKQRALRNQVAGIQYFVGVNTAWAPGVPIQMDNGDAPDILPVDADGDGISDSLAVEAKALGLSEAQLAELAPLLNPDSKPRGNVYLGLRIVAHGGMVNLNESHPALVENLFARRGEANYVHAPSLLPDQGHGFYSPQVNEYSLRRRNGLPPRVLAPSRMLGNSFEQLSRQEFPYGAGDLAEVLFPPAYKQGTGLDFDTPYTGGHRYWPYRNAQDDIYTSPLTNEQERVWTMRMEPERSLRVDPEGIQYDHMHLFTTISHDEQFVRGVRREATSTGVGPQGTPPLGTPLGFGDDVLTLMREANRYAWHPEYCEPPFEIVDYPQDLANESTCNCPTDSSCVYHPLKGRLKLSIPWLQKQLEANVITSDQQKRLVHDAFIMMLMNARDRADVWGTYDAEGRWIRNHAALSRAAASLTANFFDFADTDNVPTRIAQRDVDFGDFSEGYLRRVGGELDANPNNVGPDPDYVYGLEEQPFISEVAIAYAAWTEGQGPPPNIADEQTGWAVEVFNPYATDINTNTPESQYSLVAFDPAAGPGQPGHIANAERINVGALLRAGQFTVFVAGGSDALGSSSGLVVDLGGAYTDTLRANWTIALVRRVLYTGDALATEIVVDQFNATGLVPTDSDTLTAGSITTNDIALSAERVCSQTDRWRVLVPKTERLALGLQTLGDNNSHMDENIRPVEMRFASTGDLTTSYPTTGSMLLLMRLANRALAFTGDTQNLNSLAFTTRLLGVRQPQLWNMTIANGVVIDAARSPVATELSAHIDNGRMPVFDPGYLHHLEPLSFQTDALGNLLRDPMGLPLQEPELGGTERLPWGQLVFDYFTALPLSNPGPYRPEPGQENHPEFAPGDNPAAQPRVDMNGVRVHGRINLNAAPYTVLSGLPLIPMSRIPGEFRGKIRNAVGLVSLAAEDPYTPDPSLLVVSDEEAATIGPDLAKAIVAYREQREFRLDPVNTATGDYGGATGDTRGWKAPQPTFRQGTGFLTVGELANIRSESAFKDPAWQPIRAFGGYSNYRTDAGLVGAWVDGTSTGTNPEDYVSAVAMLVAMGDWVTVRSQVFTVYGTLRGELDMQNSDFDIEGEDQATRLRRIVEDADTRAIRFQETIDRLPTLLGERLPARIGERVLAGYTDVHND